MKIEKAIKQGKAFRNEYHRTTVNLIFTGRWIFNLHNELFKTHGLTLQQYNILKILKGQYPKSATVKLIRERMLDKMSDASRIVENLRKKELLERDLNTGDRRKVDVLISQKGLDLLNSIEEKDSKTMDDFLSKLNMNEVEQLNSLLDKLR
jgi:DNA-binding MarR family transcriptional regulator